jgi:tRNA dimethylallyltransferase
VSDKPLLVVVGPTAVGKTALSLVLAQSLGGEIVSADSRLLYKGMDIGTDKPSQDVLERVRHHLIDICRPDETVTLGQYQRLAYEHIGKIQRRDALPILVGGTGQYVRAVVEGWGIPAVPPQDALRRALGELEANELSRWLQRLDPDSAESIDPRNVRRVTRALEVTLITGRPMSFLQRRQAPDYIVKMLGLTCEREVLYGRIDRRVDRMMEAGLLDELKHLRRTGYVRDLPSMSGLGYRQLWAYLAGECTLDEAVERIKFETHRFVRQQYTWFRSGDPMISWFDVQEQGWEERAMLEARHWQSSLRRA